MPTSCIVEILNCTRVEGEMISRLYFGLCLRATWLTFTRCVIYGAQSFNEIKNKAKKGEENKHKKRETERKKEGKTTKKDKFMYKPGFNVNKSNTAESWRLARVHSEWTSRIHFHESGCLPGCRPVKISGRLTVPRSAFSIVCSC